MNFTQDEQLDITEGSQAMICLNHSGALEREVVIFIVIELLDASDIGKQFHIKSQVYLLMELFFAIFN